MARFRDLAIGETFDFVNDAKPSFVTFWATCKKISARKYSYPIPNPQYVTRVGSINVEVFHVNKETK